MNDLSNGTCQEIGLIRRPSWRVHDPSHTVGLILLFTFWCRKQFRSKSGKLFGRLFKLQHPIQRRQDSCVARSATLDQESWEEIWRRRDESATNRTPETPGQEIVRPIKDEQSEPLVSSEDQALYRSGVGMLLYLVKHSRPDIANVVRELSKVMDGATPAALK